MGFYINEEQKMRIPLSEKARLTMAEDMDIFNVDKAATFINTVFENFRDDARSSISLYLQQKELELDRLLTETPLDNTSRRIVIRQMLNAEEKKIRSIAFEYASNKTEGKLYHINARNTKYLSAVCEEQDYYSRPSQYVRSVIEEYCSLPFIKRERIYRRSLYEIIEKACKEHRILKVLANYYDKQQLFYVYPYKIVPDTFHTQSYLVCYSRKAEEEEKDKIIASFSMVRLNEPTLLTKTFHLNKAEIAVLDEQLAKNNLAYLVGEPEQIKVRLTEKGKRSYQSRLYSRPEKIESLSTNDVYVFNCTPQQIYNYFIPFGADAEILSPTTLRNRFCRVLSTALQHYS